MKPAKRYRCEECGKSYGSVGHLTRHVRVHTGERPYKCDQCDKSFMRKDHLDDHSFSHTSYRPFPCSQCDMKFYTKQKLKRHEDLHDRPKPYVCEYCSEAFLKKNQLARHVAEHTGKLPFPCPEPDCEQEFSMPAALRRHQEHRHSLSTYVCMEPNCNADPFKKFSQLQRHLKLHRPVQTHECDACGKRFRNACSLQKHKPIHQLPVADRMIHKCQFPGCNAAYTSSGNLGTHVRSKHLNREAFTCEHCRARFSIKSSYERHVRNLHGDGLNKKDMKFVCRICNIGNPSRAALRRHMRGEHKTSASLNNDQACQPVSEEQSDSVMDKTSASLNNDNACQTVSDEHIDSVMDKKSAPLNKDNACQTVSKEHIDAVMDMKSASLNNDNACQTVSKEQSDSVMDNEEEQRTGFMIADPRFLDYDVGVASSVNDDDDDASRLKAIASGPAGVSTEVHPWVLHAEPSQGYCGAIGNIDNFRNQIQSKRQQLEPSEAHRLSGDNTLATEVPINPEEMSSLKPKQRSSPVLV